MNWYYKTDDKVVGPISKGSIAELQACGVLEGSTQVRRDGTELWTTYDEALGDQSGESTPPPPPTTPEVLIKFQLKVFVIELRWED